MDPTSESSYRAPQLAADDIDAYLAEHQRKSLLRFITCGSVDDGKSTLIGRLLYDSKMLFEDQLAALQADSKRIGTQGQRIDFALLVDGLAAEREQGSPSMWRIDSLPPTGANSSWQTPRVTSNTRATWSPAHRRRISPSFSSMRAKAYSRRRDATAISRTSSASECRARGQQDGSDRLRPARPTRRSSPITARSRTISGSSDFSRIPISGLEGDNIVESPCARRGTPGRRSSSISKRSRWTPPRPAARVPHAGAMGESPEPGLSRFHGHDLQRPGAAGRCGARLPSGRTSRVARIVTFDGDVPRAMAGESVTLTLTDEVDCQPGRCDLDGGSSAGGGRPVRGHRRVDGRRGIASRTPVLVEARHADGRRRPCNNRNTR